VTYINKAYQIPFVDYLSKKEIEILSKYSFWKNTLTQKFEKNSLEAIIFNCNWCNTGCSSCGSCGGDSGGCAGCNSCNGCE